MIFKKSVAVGLLLLTLLNTSWAGTAPRVTNRDFARKPVRCVLCHASADSGIIQCVMCKAQTHRNCFDEISPQNCPTMGCPSSRWVPVDEEGNVIELFANADDPAFTFWSWMRQPYTPEEEDLLPDLRTTIDSQLHLIEGLRIKDMLDYYQPNVVVMVGNVVGIAATFPLLMVVAIVLAFKKSEFSNSQVAAMVLLTLPTVIVGTLAISAAKVPARLYILVNRTFQYLKTQRLCRRSLSQKARKRPPDLGQKSKLTFQPRRFFAESIA